MKSNIPIYEPTISKNDKALLGRVINSGWISSQGPVVNEFEKKFSTWHNMKYALATSSCTSALHLSILSLNLSKGDEIICPDLTFIAPANMIVESGAKLVLVDVNKDNCSIEINDLKKKLNKKTKALLIVHPFGHAADMETIKKVLKSKKVKIIEDVAESLGGKYKKSLLGTLGDISCFSFFGNKVMTTGEGGMILTNNKSLYKKAKILRDHGMSLKKKYFFLDIGFNYRMTSMQAAVGISQLNRLAQIIKKKQLQENIYIKHLKKFENKKFRFLKKEKNYESVNWLITIILKKKILRNKLINFLKKNYIESRPMIPPVHKAKHFARKFKDSNFKNSNQLSSSSVHLPSTLNLSEKKIKFICENVNKFFKKN